ncbi:MAG: CarboxypepD reg-like domain, partial [Bacteroidota bacterium]
MKNQCKMISWSLLFFLIPLAGAIGQSRAISGMVTDAQDGTALIGATVLVVGTTIGTVTDLDGKY